MTEENGIDPIRQFLAEEFDIPVESINPLSQSELEALKGVTENNEKLESAFTPKESALGLYLKIEENGDIFTSRDEVTWKKVDFDTNKVVIDTPEKVFRCIIWNRQYNGLYIAWYSDDVIYISKDRKVWYML